MAWAMLYSIDGVPNFAASRCPSGGGMDASLMGRMKELEAENARLKKMYADVHLQNDVIKEAR